MYDYLLPSPCTDRHGHEFGNFYPNMRNPPHSAGLVANVTNEEYFLTRHSYVNQKLDDQLRLSASNGNIPNSLV